MNKRYLLFMLILMFSFIKVNAETCSLQDQTTINNEAGSVSAKAYAYENERYIEDEETDESGVSKVYYGMIDIYNLTENLYAVLEYDNKRIRLDYNNQDVISYTTGSMVNVRDCTISIYSTNTTCGKSAIRTLNVTVPRENNYHYYNECDDYPDYFYCSQFMTVDSISYDDFAIGLEAYSKSHKSKSEEERKEGFLEETSSFIKKNWLIITIIIIIIIGGTGTFIYIKNKKRKEQIV